jgi:hypothetical protein
MVKKHHPERNFMKLIIPFDLGCLGCGCLPTAVFIIPSDLLGKLVPPLTLALEGS